LESRPLFTFLDVWLFQIGKKIVVQTVTKKDLEVGPTSSFGTVTTVTDLEVTFRLSILWAILISKEIVKLTTSGQRFHNSNFPKQ